MSNNCITTPNTLSVNDIPSCGCASNINVQPAHINLVNTVVAPCPTVVVDCNGMHNISKFPVGVTGFYKDAKEIIWNY